MLSHPTTILMLGTDNARVGGREGDMHSDSIMLLRTDPSHHRLYYLSIPRDIQVPIPGAGTQKINAAFQIGGPALAIRTIRQFTGLEIDHVMVINFADFKDLIDALGGIDVNGAGADPLEPVRLPVRDAGALRRLARLALPEGHAAHERQPRADLLADPREHAQPGRDRRDPRGAAAGRAERRRAEVHLARRAHARCRSRVARSRSR